MTADSSPFKRCSKCKDVKLRNEFPKNRSKKDGLGTECHECNRKRVHKWVNLNPEQADAGKRLYVERHPDRRKKTTSQYVDNNRDEINLRRRDSYRQDGARRQIKGHEYRARRRGLLTTFTSDDWRYCLDYWHGVCAYCGNPPKLWDNPRVLHQEHYVAVDLGGDYVPTNILSACRTCNSSKRNKPAEQWIAKRFGPRKAKVILKRIQDYFEWVKQRQ